MDLVVIPEVVFGDPDRWPATRCALDSRPTDFGNDGQGQTSGKTGGGGQRPR